MASIWATFGNIRATVLYIWLHWTSATSELNEHWRSSWVGYICIKCAALFQTQLQFFKAPFTPTIMAFTGVTNAHPSPQDTGLHHAVWWPQQKVTRPWQGLNWPDPVTILQQINGKNDPSNSRRWDLNSRPLGHESPPTTNRPGRLPMKVLQYLSFTLWLCLQKRFGSML